MNVYFRNNKTLEFKKISYYILVPIILTLFGLVRLGYYYGIDYGKKSQITQEDVILLYYESENSEFSKKNFYNYLKEINVKFPEIVFAQAMKECGFKSPLFRNNNNPFGMKEANKRPNIQDGVDNGHASYKTWKHAVIDYALYQSYIGVNKIKTEEEYLQYLKDMRYYDTDSPENVNYLNDLRQISHNIKDYLK
jgi:uncharacterized FlgJ-related protein